MICPDEDTVLAFAEHQLAPGEARELEHHIAICSTCRQIVSELAQVDREATAAPIVDAPSERDDDRARRHVALQRGAAVDRYMIVSLLGRGGMGVVYRAYDPDLNREVALKLVGLGALDGSTGDQARQRLLREAQTLAKLAHPNVVAVYDVGSVGDEIFIAMELVEGMTLRAWLGERPRTTAEILRVYRDAGLGLAAAHEVGIVHRDFKPDNVIVGRDGRVRVLDFGLARVEAAARASRSTFATLATSNDLSVAGTMVGTPAYMSPEQDAGLEAMAASDQFSFCVALYEALFDRSPYRGETYLERAQSRTTGDIVLPPKRAGVTSQIRRALLVGLRPSSTDRHASMNELLAVLQPTRWTRGRVGAATALALVVGVAGAWAVAHRTASAAPSCDFVAGDAAKVWNPTSRARFVAAIGRGTGSAAGVEAIARDLDQWTTQWIETRTDVCRRSIDRGSDAASNRGLAEQLQCLERRLSQLDATVVALSSWEMPVVATVQDITSQLGTSADCARVAAPQAGDAEKLAAAAKEAAAPIIRDVMDARAAARAGKLDDALVLANRAAAQAEALRSHGAVSTAQTIVADVHVMRGELDAARAAYRASALAASAEKSDDLVVGAWLGLVRTAFTDRRIDDDVRAAMFAAQVAVARLPESSAQRPNAALVAGTFHLLQGKLDDARTKLEEAIAGWTKLGADHFAGDIGQAQNGLGAIYALRGDWDAARTNLLASWDAMSRVYGRMPPVSAVKRNLAKIELRQDHFTEAERYAREALEIAGSTDRVSPVVGEAELLLADVYERSAQCERAKEHAAAARRIVSERLGADAPLLSMVDVIDARCMLARAPGRALELLQRARRAAVAHPAAIEALPEIELALALALERTGHHDEALAMARSARTRFVAIGAGMATRIRDCDRLLGTS